MADLSAQEFNGAVAAAIAGVEHLYRRVDLLLAGLREELGQEPNPLILVRGTLGKSGKEDSKRIVVRYEYGALFEPAPDDDLDADESEDDEDESEDGDGEQAAKHEPRRHEVVSAQPLLAVRIATYDPRKGGRI